MDDPGQCERAALAFRRAVEEGGAFFSATVLVEVVWVLRAAYKLERVTISAALQRLVRTAGVTVEHATVVGRAIEAYASGEADFSDCFIRESSREAEALPVLTFDQKFADGSDVELVPGA